MPVLSRRTTILHNEPQAPRRSRPNQHKPLHLHKIGFESQFRVGLCTLRRPSALIRVYSRLFAAQYFPPTVLWLRSAIYRSTSAFVSRSFWKSAFPIT